MSTWEMSFGEFEDRLNDAGYKDASVVGLWNDLAFHILGMPRPKTKGANICQLPVKKLLKLSPEAAAELEHIGAVKAALYKALHESLRRKPAQMRDLSREVSRESLVAFVVSHSLPQERVGAAWNVFGRYCLTGKTVGSIEQLEHFCNEMKDKNNWPRNLGKPQLELLEKWLRYLKR